MIVVLAQHNTPRLQYVLSELLERRMGLAYKMVSSPDEFRAAPASVKINYTSHHIEHALQVQPHGLLSETGVREVKMHITRDERWNVIFWKNENSQVPFDVFAAAFFLLSRYEEYTNPVRDGHGRFEAKHSLAFQYGFLQIPVIETWVEELKKRFLEQQPDLVFTKRTYTKLSTIDVDFAFKYKGIGIKRWVGKLGKAVLKGRFGEAGQQLLVSTGIRPDPYDTFEFIHENTNAELAYFMLLGNSGGYDKATSFSVLPAVIKRLKAQAAFIGIHPSYRSNSEEHRLSEEIGLLQKLTGSSIRHSRNHFLKLALPQTYQRLVNEGIEHDYTMMYADNIGFRAGTCHPFLFYNLHAEQSTSLTVYSTCVMDVTLKDYICSSPEEATGILNNMEVLVRKYRGMFITLWHNSSFTREGGWNGWKKVYTDIFNSKQEGL